MLPVQQDDDSRGGAVVHLAVSVASNADVSLGGLQIEEPGERNEINWEETREDLSSGLSDDDC